MERNCLVELFPAFGAAPTRREIGSESLVDITNGWGNGAFDPIAQAFVAFRTVGASFLGRHHLRADKVINLRRDFEFLKFLAG